MSIIQSISSSISHISTSIRRQVTPKNLTIAALAAVAIYAGVRYFTTRNSDKAPATSQEPIVLLKPIATASNLNTKVSDKPAPLPVATKNKHAPSSDTSEKPNLLPLHPRSVVPVVAAKKQPSIGNVQIREGSAVEIGIEQAKVYPGKVFVITQELIRNQSPLFQYMQPDAPTTPKEKDDETYRSFTIRSYRSAFAWAAKENSKVVILTPLNTSKIDLVDHKHTEEFSRSEGLELAQNLANKFSSEHPLISVFIAVPSKQELDKITKATEDQERALKERANRERAKRLSSVHQTNQTSNKNATNFN